MLSNKPDALQTLDGSLFRLVNYGGENKLFRVENDHEGRRLQFLNSISIAMRESREIAIVFLRRVFTACMRFEKDFLMVFERRKRN